MVDGHDTPLVNSDGRAGYATTAHELRGTSWDWPKLLTTYDVISFPSYTSPIVRLTSPSCGIDDMTIHAFLRIPVTGDLTSLVEAQLTTVTASLRGVHFLVGQFKAD